MVIKLMVKKEDRTELHTAYIGIGSNIGDRFNNIKNAELEINSSGNSKVVEISKIYETEPVGYLNQAEFLNCVFKIETYLEPVQLMKSLIKIEKILKRVRVIHWGPRTIDLDIIFYDNIISTAKDALIPHPRMHERMFVLKPLCDLDPSYIHPVINKSCIHIAEKLESEQPSPLEWVPPPINS